MTDRVPQLGPPTAEEIRELADTHDLDLNDDEVALFERMLPGVLAPYERLERLPDPDPSTTLRDRDPGARPSPDEDPSNAIVRRCAVPGVDDGPLDGYRVGVKDNVAVAGVEMTCGSTLLDGYVPWRDATVVTALLDAGATIEAKTNMPSMAYTGSGELTATGDVLNPRDRDYLAGGSSGGSAAAVVEGTVDVAIGTDQSGSIRIPAAWCGCVGHKPTHGLVPYTGIVGLGPTFDHVGPLTGAVEDCALAMDVMAVEDPLDPRQRSPPAGGYASAVATDGPDATVSLLTEGFDGEAVSRTVRESLGDLEDADAGTTVEEVSVPMHRDGRAIYSGVANEETTALFRDDGIGRYHGGYYDERFAATFGRARRTNGDDLPVTLKLILVAGEYLSENYYGTYHAKAQNLTRSLAAAYDEALAASDILAMPTTKRPPLEVEDDLTPKKAIIRSAGMLGNVAPFDVTGHPAISVPCGTVNGLPVGLMLVGERGDDATVLSVARDVEAALDPDL
jgi:amidase